MWPLTVEGAEIFGLLLVRCMGFYIAGPIFAQRGLPAQVKILLGVATAVALFPVASGTGVPPHTGLAGFLLAVAGEAFMGVILAFGASFAFIGIRMAAGLLGIQMGFGIVSVMSARNSGRTPIIAQIYDILASQMLAMAGSMFVVALSVGGPLIAVLFLTDAAMGFVARTVPQMNIFIVGFPIKIGLGLLGIAISLPFFFTTVQRLITDLEHDLLTMLSGM